jgi:predicted lipoprotein with Yx(FWY)xxD motif
MIKELKAPLGGRRSRGPSRTRWGGPGWRAIAAGLGAAAAAALVAACGGPGGIYGSGGGSAAGGTAGTAHHAPASHGVVISARTLPGVGTVLVDRSGKTLYSPQQEAHGTIMCTGGCLSFWFPVPVTAGATVHVPAGVTGVLGTVHRPGGLTQLTYNGKPLYTFRLDQVPGQAHGNNFTDHFGAASFTWHAVTTSGAPAGTGQPGNASGPAYQGGSRGY